MKRRVLNRWYNLLYLSIGGIIMLVGLCHLSSIQRMFTSTETRPNMILSKSANYFLTEEEYDKMGYLVNSSECRIPAIDPCHPSVIPFVDHSPPIDCGKQSGHWTYVNKTTIVLNQTAIELSGYTMEHLHCCYRSIHRDPRLFNNMTGWYSPLVDSRVVHSTTCNEMETITEPNSEFIFVTCEPKYFYWFFDERLTSKVVYKNYHALIPKQKSLDIQTKMKYWQNDKHQIEASPDNRPPNVIFLGIDATSRLNFRRSMPKTIRILESMGAHEMLGYNKVGENTFPNLIPLLTGYSEYDLSRICHFSRETKFDDCPLIWKRFSEANYLTAEIQDSPRRNHWNFEKTGFVKKPTSFYMRPFLLGIHMDAGLYPNRVECVGYQTMEEVLMHYIQDLMEFSNTSKMPLFVASWLTQLAHDSMNSLQFGDSTFAIMLESLVNQGALDNTILIIASDHGYRYGDIRETISGYYEDKLPNLWIRLPPWIVREYPEWEEALHINSRKLSSNYYLYKTFAHILDTFTNTSEINTKVERKYGQSFFKPIPSDTSCSSAGIPEAFCACDFPVSLPQSSQVLKGAAEEAVKDLNKLIPNQCSKFTLFQVKGGATLSKLGEDKLDKTSSLIVEFTVKPGDFVFEANVAHRRISSTKSKFNVQSNIQRLSQFNTDVSCVEDPVMQLYCFC